MTHSSFMRLRPSIRVSNIVRHSSPISGIGPHQCQQYGAIWIQLRRAWLGSFERARKGTVRPTQDQPSLVKEKGGVIGRFPKDKNNGTINAPHEHQGLQNSKPTRNKLKKRPKSLGNAASIDVAGKPHLNSQSAVLTQEMELKSLSLSSFPSKEYWNERGIEPPDPNQINQFHQFLTGEMGLFGGRPAYFKIDYEQFHHIDNMCPAVQCKYDVEIPYLGKRTAVGYGYTRDTARIDASTRLTSDLLSCGDLDKILLNSSRLEPQEIQKASDVMFDIFVHAAKHGLVPDCSVELVEHPITKQDTKLARKRLTAPAKLESAIRINITVPDWNVEVSVMGPKFDTALAIAVRAYKQKLESRGISLNTKALSNSGFALLTPDMAAKFRPFYRTLYPLKRFKTNTETSTIGFSLFIHHLKIDGKQYGVTFPMSSKALSEALTYLTTTVQLVKEEGFGILQKFHEAFKEGNGSILRPVPSIYFHPEEDAIDTMNKSIKSLTKQGLSLRTVDDLGLEPAKESAAQYIVRPEPNRTHTPRRRFGNLDYSQRAHYLFEMHQDYLNNEALAHLRAARKDLPVSQYQHEILTMVQENVFSIIVGATGSGKTTQVSQILLEDHIMREDIQDCNIICTQPRRIAAVSVARRVAAERAEPVGDTIGYHVRGEAFLPSHGGSITFCTTGILLDRLKHAPETLDNISHILIDEVHERDLYIDYLMIVLKKVISARRAMGKPHPRVILMSATLDTELFSNYFSVKRPDGTLAPCPLISVPGRTYPVYEHFLEDILPRVEHLHAALKVPKGTWKKYTRKYLEAEERFVLDGQITGSKRTEVTDLAVPETIQDDEQAVIPIGLVAATIVHICESTDGGAILVFLPGFQEMEETKDLLHEYPQSRFDFGDRSKFRIFFLHSSVPKEEQQSIFNPVPEGCRKIILSTNIAETSVTIPEVKFVVDTGKVRERHVLDNGMRRLSTSWASKSNCKQRAGRAGRVQNGNYYALFSKARYDSLARVGLPEIMRSDLQAMCLGVKSHQFKESIQEFLSQAIEPPPAAHVQNAIESLKALNALTADEKLTGFGRLLSNMYIPPSLGRMILLAVRLRCLEPVLINAAAVDGEGRSLFIHNPGTRRQLTEERSRLPNFRSDHFALIEVFKKLRGIQYTEGSGSQSLYDFAAANSLHMGSFNTMNQSVRVIEAALAEAGLADPYMQRLEYQDTAQLGGAELNENSDNIDLVRAVLVSGFYPNLAIKNQPPESPTFRTKNSSTAIMHTASVNFDRDSMIFRQQNPPGTMYAYSSLSRNGSVVFFSEATKITPLMALLFGGPLHSKKETLVIEDWLPIRTTSDLAAKTLFAYREALDKLLGLTYDSLSEPIHDPKGLRDENQRLFDVFTRNLLRVLDRCSTPSKE